MAYSKEFYEGLKNNNLKRAGFKNYYVPELIRIFENAGEHLESVIDVGCGTGTLLSEFAKQGVTDIFGMDFCSDRSLLEIPPELFLEIDLNLLSSAYGTALNKKYQLAICLEVAEHLDNTSADSLVEFLTGAADVVWFSAAIPYQGGDGHVNEQWPSYWEEKFRSHGYVRVDWFRRKTWDQRELIGYYRQNMLLYVKSERLRTYPCLQEYYETYNDMLPRHMVHPTVYNYSVRTASDHLHTDPYPETKLLDCHLRHAGLLPDREALLEKMPKGGVAAEVGVAEGGFSRKILDVCRPKKLYCIDVWFNEKAYEKTLAVLKPEIESGIVEILKGDSVEQLLRLRDQELDFVYIDAMHDYKHPKKELEICRSKVKNDGYLMGHDYTIIDEKMDPPERYGVVNAVNEFAAAFGYEFLYLTMEHLFMNPSYCLRKMEN